METPHIGSTIGGGSSGIGYVLLLGIAGLGLYFTFLSLVFIGKTLFTAVVTLTFPALIKSFFTFSTAELSVISCLNVACEGVFVGLFIGCVRSLIIRKKILIKYSKKHSEIGKSLISGLLTFEVFNFDVSLTTVILLHTLVGFGVGFVQGAAGIPGLIQAILFTDTAISNNTIIGALIQGGGAGGAGTGNAFSFVLFILIIFIVQGIITGITTGVTLSVLSGAISGAIKTGSIELLLSLMSDVENNPTESRKNKIIQATKNGVILGAVVGGIVGLIQGIITLIIVSSSKKH